MGYGIEGYGINFLYFLKNSLPNPQHSPIILIVEGEIYKEAEGTGHWE